MPKIDEARTFKRLDNASVLNRIRNDSSPSYQERVPDATKGNLEQVLDSIFDYPGPRNEFIHSITNIAVKISRGVVWGNPLTKYKRAALSYGDRIEQTQIGLAKAYVYDENRDYLERILFGRETPEVMTAVHTITRKEFYKVTVDTVALRRAFYDEFGLNDFISELLRAPATADEVDEFEATVSMFRHFYDRDGFHIVNVPNVTDLDSDAPDARNLTRRVRATASNLRFVSRHYNAAKMPVAAQPEGLVLFITPEAQAAVDVEALAAAFNEDRANMPFRTEIIPSEKLNIPGAQAVLSTDDFLIVADTAYETRTQQNAADLIENQFLHHHEIISVNPFAPAVLFSSTDASTVIETTETPVTGVEPLTVYDLKTDTDVTSTPLAHSALYQVGGSAVTTPEGGVNDGVKLVLSGAESPMTYVTNSGALFVAPDESAETLTITATALDNEAATESVTVTLDDVLVDYWPADALTEVTPEAPTAAGNDVTIPAVDGVTYTVNGAPVSGTYTMTEDTTVVAVPQAGYVFPDGATASWEFTFTAA